MAEVSRNAGLTGTEWRQMADLQAMADETLHPDLQPWVEKHETFGTILRHPLVYDFTVSVMPGAANETYRRKQIALAEAIEDGDWHTVVFLHERAYRLKALIEYVTGCDDLTGEPCCAGGLSQDMLDLVADVWIDSENIEQNLDEWRALFCNGAGGLWLGTPDERQAFDRLPDPVHAYRAGIADGDWSWTTDRKVAEFFARRFRENDPLEVIEADIAKADCFGYFTRRGESELLVRIK